MSTEIIAVVNQKGGVGKTTSAVNLATAFAAVEKRTLLIDLDAQGNASTGLGFPESERVRTTYDMILGQVRLPDVIVKTGIPKLDLLPASINLSAVDVELADMSGREFVLKQQLQQALANYDYIFIDCPPSLGLLTVNALTAATAVLIPLQCEFYALEGLSHLLNTVALVQKGLNPTLSILGIALTMYDRRNRLTNEVEKDVRDCLGEQVFETVVPRNVRLSEAPSHSKPAIIYDMHCPGSRAYIFLAKEILARYTARTVAEEQAARQAAQEQATKERILQDA
ncbi:MAG: ParA family protein [Hyphomicrobiales bacterium]|nr:ParA family protein [Hyphomicrobiales bacterium]